MVSEVLVYFYVYDLSKEYDLKTDELSKTIPEGKLKVLTDEATSMINLPTSGKVEKKHLKWYRIFGNKNIMLTFITQFLFNYLQVTLYLKIPYIIINKLN